MPSLLLLNQVPLKVTFVLRYGTEAWRGSSSHEVVVNGSIAHASAADSSCCVLGPIPLELCRAAATDNDVVLELIVFDGNQSDLWVI